MRIARQSARCTPACCRRLNLLTISVHYSSKIGGVVAFISGIGQITEPWGDLVNYFRNFNITQANSGS